MDDKGDYADKQDATDNKGESVEMAAKDATSDGNHESFNSDGNVENFKDNSDGNEENAKDNSDGNVENVKDNSDENIEIVKEVDDGGIDVKTGTDDDIVMGQNAIDTGLSHWLMGGQLAGWDVSNKSFWETTGYLVGYKNLLISLGNLCAAFGVWLIWSIVVTSIQDAHDADKTVYPFGVDENDDDEYKSLLYTFPAIAGLSGATLRIPNSFMTKTSGERASWAWTSTLLIVPCILLGVLLNDKDPSYELIIVLAALTGVGGGAFASSMSNISGFFPSELQGLALGLNAGLGNLGVSLTQLVCPLIVGDAVFGGSSIGNKYLWNSGWFWTIFIGVFLVPAWTMCNTLPKNGNNNLAKNSVSYLHLELLVFLSVAANTGIYLAFMPLVQGKEKAPLKILVIIFCCTFACMLTLLLMRFCVGEELKGQLLSQKWIFSDRNNWYMTYLYFMTFGSFIGYSAVFPKLIKDVFCCNNETGEDLTDAPLAKEYGFLGALVGSLIRPVGGWLGDRYGGAFVTHVNTIIQIIATVIVGVVIDEASNSPTPNDYFPTFLVFFLILFAATGSSNGSTFKQIAVLFDKQKRGPVLGWTSAVAAYGAAIFPAVFGAAVEGNFVGPVFYFFAAYYASCLALNWYFYYGRYAKYPC